MKCSARLVALALALLPPVAPCEEYPISNPGQAMSAPVHTTQPVEGAVQVTNLPPVQEVHVTGGRLDEPLEVRGEVGLRVVTPLPVEVVNPSRPSSPSLAPLKVDDTQPLRVWVENPWSPDSAPPPEFATFAFQSRFLPSEGPLRRQFSPRAGRVFYLTDVVADVRPDVGLKVRVLTTPRAVAGAVSGVEFAEYAVAVLDARRGSGLRLATPVPLVGDFTVEVEVLGAVQGGYFTASVVGYQAPRP